MHTLAWAPDPACRILQYGAQTIDERWRYRFHDPFWRLYLNDVEGAWVEGAAGAHRLDPGRIHLLPAWLGLASRCRGRVRHHYWHADLGDWGRNAFPVPVAVAVTAEDARLFRRLAAGEAWSVADRLRARALALACLARAAEGCPGLEAAAAGDPVERARRHLDARLAEPFDQRRLAEACGLSPGHLRARFRAAVGRSPAAWLRERRIAAAAGRLIAGDESLEAIATAVGFANRFHFSRVFARLVGVGPATYRAARRLGTVADTPRDVASAP